MYLISKNLKYLMVKNNISVKELSLKINLSSGTIYKILNKENYNLQTKNLVKICLFFNVKFQSICFEELYKSKQ